MKFFLVNTVSKRRTKMARKAAPIPQKYQQRLCGGTIVLRRGKHFPLTYAQLEQYHNELEAKQKVGAIEIREGSPMGPIVQFDMLDEPKSIEEVKDAPPVAEESDDASEDTAGDAMEDPKEGNSREEVFEEDPDFLSMTNRELVSIILEHSDEWPETELKKMKKVELLELLS